MSTSKHLDKICIIVLIAALLVTVLFLNGEALGLTAIVDEDAESYTGDEYFTANDLNGSWDTGSATMITLDGDSIKISGNGAYSSDGSVYIGSAGYYVISGTLSDGSIVVDAYDSSKVWILLNGVTIHCSDNAGILIKQADKVFLTLAEGTENTVTTGDSYSDEAVADNINGAIYSADDLTINGGGSLTVTAGYYHGIKCKDDLVITGGTITVTAPEDGIHGNADVYFTGADLNIDAGDDGIHADDEFLITGGTILISECYEGIEALTIDVQDGDITVYPTDDGLNANGNSGSGFGMGGFGGRGGFGAESESTESSASSTDDDSETWVHISGGTITVINDSGRDADGIDSNANIIITGGAIYVSLIGDGSNSAIDYGSENGGVFEISGGTVVACGGSSMAETFDSSSTQPGILYYLSDTAEAGTTVRVLDSNGNELLSYTAECSFTAVNLSCPELTVGETVTVAIGDTTEEVTIDSTSMTVGSGGNMGMGGGNMGGKGDFGRHGGFGQDATEGSEWDGERPERSSEFEGMEPPEMNSEFDGQMPDFMQSSKTEETASSTGTAITDLGADVWIGLLASIALLVFGILFVLLWQRHG